LLTGLIPGALLAAELKDDVELLGRREGDPPPAGRLAGAGHGGRAADLLRRRAA